MQINASRCCPQQTTSQALDVGDKAEIQKIFDVVKPDIVINAAAYTKVDDAETNSDLAERTNFHAVKHLCDACLNHHSLLIHFSTDYVFDGVLNRSYRRRSNKSAERIWPI